MISTEEAHLLSDTPKIIYDDIKWEWDGSKYVANARVECRDRDDVLRFTAWRNNRRYSFSLLYRNAITIRRWGNHPGHTNPNDELIEGPHKHYYKEGYEDGWAYNTDDISTSDVRQAFFDFLDEESIELVNSATYQTDLSDIDD